MTVQKFYSDFFHPNTDFAYLAGMPLKDLNRIEKEYLEILDYELVVKDSDLDLVHANIRAFFIQGNASMIETIRSEIEFELQLINDASNF